MKTYFSIMAALAVIASASADTNAICGGRIGNHGILNETRSYITCVQRMDGDVVAEIQECPNNNEWCPQTENCCPPEECHVVIPGTGNENNITIIITNEVDEGCGDGCDDSSSSSSSSSEEDEGTCPHGQEQIFFEHEDKPGCYYYCKHHGSSRHHDHHNWEDKFAHCARGVCKGCADTPAHCREEHEVCNCCGTGCDDDEEPEPVDDCPTGHHPAENPNPKACDNSYCCNADTESKLFGSVFRGQIQTGQCDIPATCSKTDEIYCKDLKRCTSIHHLEGECKEKYEKNCCYSKPDHAHCSGYIFVCYGHETPKTCPDGHYFYEPRGCCVGPEDEEDYWKAKSACLCHNKGDGRLPVSDGTCRGFKCCNPHSAPAAIFGLEPQTGGSNCVPGDGCPDGTFFCSRKGVCVNYSHKTTTDCQTDFNNRCCHYTSDCDKYTKTCVDDNIPHEHQCPNGLAFCTNLNDCGKQSKDQRCISTCKCQPGDEYFTFEGQSQKKCCKKAAEHKDIWRELFAPDKPIRKCDRIVFVCENTPCATGTKACGAHCIDEHKTCSDGKTIKDICSTCEYDGTEESKKCIRSVTYQDHTKKDCHLYQICLYDGTKFQQFQAGRCHQEKPGFLKPATNSGTDSDNNGNPCAYCDRAQLDKLGLFHVPEGCTDTNFYKINCCKAKAEAELKPVME